VTVEDRDRRYCSDCERVIWRTSNPIVCQVHTDGEVCLVEQRDVSPAQDQWGILGGNLGYDEHPRIGMARDPREKTALEIGPDERTLVRVEYEVRKGDRRSRHVTAYHGGVWRESRVRDDRSAFRPPEGVADNGGIASPHRNLIEAILPR
jgi:ADP-ribose pyrophosphatase YjhB (NUDIX family)